MKDTSLKLFVDYPHAINQKDVMQDNRCWRNFLDNVPYEGLTYDKTAAVDRILDIQYNAVRTTSGLRFKHESDLLMFLLRFS
jgi:hypothetical protein